MAHSPSFQNAASIPSWIVFFGAARARLRIELDVDPPSLAPPRLGAAEALITLPGISSAARPK